MRRSRAALLLGRFGAKPPSSPTPVASPFSFSSPLSVWKTSEATRRADEKFSAPAGTSMNSWKSRPLSAWAAVQDVDHRHRHEPAADAPEIGVEREPRVVRRRPRDGERDREDRVGTERRLVRRAVELEQRLVHGRLLGGLHPLDLGGDRLLDVPHGPVHASSLVALTITVA